MVSQKWPLLISVSANTSHPGATHSYIIFCSNKIFLSSCSSERKLLKRNLLSIILKKHFSSKHSHALDFHFCMMQNDAAMVLLYVLVSWQVSVLTACLYAPAVEACAETFLLAMNMTLMVSSLLTDHDSKTLLTLKTLLAYDDYEIFEINIKLKITSR